MLLFYLYGLYVCLLSLPLGYALLAWVLPREAPALGMAWHLLAGLAGLGLVGAILSWWVPLAYAPVVLVPMAAGLAAYHRHGLGSLIAQTRATWQRWDGVTRLLGLLLLLVAGIRAAMPSALFDEGLYYTAFIRWSQQYGVVPGLGNLHHRLAFNSHWHLLQAALDWTALAARPLHDLNAWLWLVMGGLSLDSLARLRRGESRAWDGFALGWLCLSPHWLAFYTGPTADLAVLYLTWGLAWLCLRRLPWQLGAILAVWAVTLKLSALPVLLFPLYACLRARDGSWRQGGRPALVALLLGLPWLVRSYLLSGYALFPARFSAVGQPDWQVPAEAAANAARAVRAWARRPGAHDFWHSISEPLTAWLPRWWEGLPGLDQGLILAAVLLPLAGWPALARPRRPGRRDALAVGFITLVGGLFWFGQAPDPRFGYGWLALPLWLGLGIYLRPGRSRPVLVWLLTAALGVSLLMSFRQADRLEPAGLVQPAPALRPAVTPIGVALQPVRGDRCYDAPLPCTTEPKAGLERRGASLGAGFRLAPAPPSHEVHR